MKSDALKRRGRTAAAVVACVLCFAPTLSALTIKKMDTASDLAGALVGDGITISNVEYQGASAASGYFSGGEKAGIGIENGIVLTSGYAKNLTASANTSGSKTGYNKMPGDSQLGALIPGYSTYDAAVLSFDFVSSGDSAYFNYVFGSEEYPEWVNSSFNDVFGFFVDGENYALLPDSTPVSINTLNINKNSDLYNDNSTGDYKIEYDGFTDVLTASLTDLTPGQSYNITLAVADAGDYSYDSGIFLEAGSFSETDPGDPSPVPEPSTVVLLLFGTAFCIHRYRRRLCVGEA